MLICLLLEFAYFACESLKIILHPNKVLLDLYLNEVRERRIQLNWMDEP